MAEPNVVIQIKLNTKNRFLTIQKEFAKNPDLRATSDYVLRKLMDKYEGDNQ